VTYISLAVAALLAVPFVAFSQVTQERTTQNGDEAAIRQLLDEQSAALKRKDVDALERMWAPDYIFVNPTGQVVTKDKRINKK
jgi:ketosteroid isomerase-like protein